jgi:threonine dehydratase
VAIAESPTLADGLAGNVEPGSITYPLIARHVDDVVDVPEDGLRAAMRDMAAMDHLILEGSAAVAVAALDALDVSGLRVAVVASGRNITLDAFLRAVT